LTLEELVAGPTQISFLNEPVDYEVDFAVRGETALERARRRWRMPAQEDERYRTQRKRVNEELAEAEAERNRAQLALDRAWQRMRDFDDEERRLHRQLDPYGWGHWN